MRRMATCGEGMREGGREKEEEKEGRTRRVNMRMTHEFKPRKPGGFSLFCREEVEKKDVPPSVSSPHFYLSISASQLSKESHHLLQILLKLPQRHVLRRALNCRVVRAQPDRHQGRRSPFKQSQK